MGGEPLTVDQLTALSRLPAREVLHGQLVGVVASPITGLVRGLNALIAGLAIQLRQIADEGLLPAGEAATTEASADEPSTEEAPAEEPSAEEEAAAEEPAAEEDEQAEPPSEGEEEKEG
jgi:large subunit ribosomal protein L10